MDEKFNGSLLLFTNHVVKKVIYLCGKPKQRMSLKVQASEALKQQYPKAKFFTVVRHPLDRFQSFINFIKVLCVDGPHGKVCMGLTSTYNWKVIHDYVISF